MSCSFLAAVAERVASLTNASDAVLERLSLATLPHDLLVLLAERMLGAPAPLAKPASNLPLSRESYTTAE